MECPTKVLKPIFHESESLLDECINSVGGVKVRSLFAESPSFDNADYALDNYNIIAELKCLQDDKSNDPVFLNKIKEKFSNHLEKEKKQIFGTILINSSQVSENCTKEILDIFRKPIQTLTKKANKQIRETKQNLHKENAHGLLILINDNNKLFEPSLIIGLVGECLRRDRLSSIDSVLYLTINLTATNQDESFETLVWVECSRDPNNQCNQEFYIALRKALYSKLGIASERTLTFGPQNHKFLESLKNKGQKELFFNLDNKDS